MTEIVTFCIAILISAACLWAGMKITKVEGSFAGMLGIATVSSLFGLIPVVGWILGTVVMFVLICKWTTANFWPDAILMVVVARLVGILSAFVLIAAMAKIFS
jgi:hypothetical protein